MARLLEQKFYAKYLPHHSAVELRHVFHNDQAVRANYILNRRLPPGNVVRSAIARCKARRHIAGDSETSAVQSRGSLAAESSFATSETSDYNRAAARQPCSLQNQVRHTIETLGGFQIETTDEAESDDSVCDITESTTDDSDICSGNDTTTDESTDYGPANQELGETKLAKLTKMPRDRKAPKQPVLHKRQKKLAHAKSTANGNHRTRRDCKSRSDVYGRNVKTSEELTTRQTAAAMAEFLGVRNGMGRQGSLPAALATISDSLTVIMGEQRSLTQSIQAAAVQGRLGLNATQSHQNQQQQQPAQHQQQNPFLGPVDVYAMPAGGPLSNAAATMGLEQASGADYRTVLASFTQTVTRLNGLVSRAQAKHSDLAATVADGRLEIQERKGAAKLLVKEVLTLIDQAYSPDDGGALLRKQFYFDLQSTTSSNTSSSSGLIPPTGSGLVGNLRGPYIVNLRNIVFTEYLNRLPQRADSQLVGSGNLQTIVSLAQQQLQDEQQRGSVPVGATASESALYACPVTHKRRSDQRVRELHRFIGSRIGRYLNGYDEIVVPIVEDETLSETSCTCSLYLFIDCLTVVDLFSNSYLRPAERLAPASGGLHPAATDLMLHQQGDYTGGFCGGGTGGISTNSVVCVGPPRAEFVASRLRYLIRCLLHSMTHIVSLLHPEVRADHIHTHSHPVYTTISNVYEPLGVVRKR